MNPTDTLPALRAASDQLQKAQDEVATAMNHLHFAENAYQEQFAKAIHDTQRIAAGLNSQPLTPANSAAQPQLEFNLAR